MLRYKKNSKQYGYSALSRSKFPLGPMDLQLVEDRVSLGLPESFPWSIRRSDSRVPFHWHHILDEHFPDYPPWNNSSQRESPGEKIPWFTTNSTTLSGFLDYRTFMTPYEEVCVCYSSNLFIRNSKLQFRGMCFGRP